MSTLHIYHNKHLKSKINTLHIYHNKHHKSKINTLHIYHNKHLKSKINTFNKNDVIILHNRITINLLKHLFRMNHTDMNELNLTFITIEELLQGKIDNMRFDYIVGNPPYQDSSGSDAGSLYVDITRKSLALLTPNGIIDFITPTTIAQVKKTGFTLQGQRGLKLLDYSVNKYFNVGVKVCRWQIDKSYDDDVQVTEIDGTSEKRKYTDLMVMRKDLLGFRLFEKIKKNKNKLFVLDQGTGGSNKQSSKNEIYRYKIFVNIAKGSVAYSKIKPKLYKRKKIVFGMGLVYNESNMFITIEDVGQYQCAIDISNNTKKQIENIKKFLFSDLCVAICKKYRIQYNTGINAILYSFPKIDVNKEYTQKDTQELFNLTDDEVSRLLQ